MRNEKHTRRQGTPLPSLLGKGRKRGCRGGMSVLSGGLLFGLLLLLSCAAESEYTTYPCRFVFNTDMHSHSGALTSATQQLSPGVFCKVTHVVKGGASYYRFTTNQGLTDDVPYTAIEERTTPQLGMNNAIVLGYGNLSSPATFYGYDGECPNCFSPDRVPVVSRPLTLTTDGRAVCASCHREYDLNNGGNITKGATSSADKKLTRYHASCLGTVVSVTN